MSSRDEQSAWAHGLAAQRLGEGLDTNPHPKGGEKHREWSSGWLAAQRAARDGLRPSAIAEPFDWGEPIHTYTRKQAIEDGVLVDVTEIGRAPFREVGIRQPVAMTTTAFGRYVEVSEALQGEGQSIAGRLYDVAWMLRCAITGQRAADRSEILFRFHCLTGDGPKQGNESRSEIGPRHAEVTLKAHVGGGDDGEAVMTIMLPEED